ncbi:uncharacterized protein C4orf19 homolog [Molossus molossus]|uniref:Uncharacterized protein n=1 Tax=Molossus molossus TaxID=27622 RepID=A0A7J8JS05_MOLMO|nr:uncharacterized protein C4orf19 homolog [Molossus molossus]KAF6499260.1 hypothetical protein HJG59_001882 [Molossus molossus]
MGCRCCKVIQSYLFDPVQVPSPGYVNDVSSCKLDEEDAVKLKGKQSIEALVHKNDLQSEGLKGTGSRSRRAGPQEPGGPPQGPHPGRGHCAEKTGSAVNGIGPTAALQPTEALGPQQDGAVSWAGTVNSVHPTQPSLEGGDAGAMDRALPASEETPVVRNGDSRVPSKADRPATDVQGRIPQIPAPDYPQRPGSAGDKVGHEEEEDLFGSHPAEAPPEATRPGPGEQGANMPFARKRSWDSLNEAVAAEVLSVYFKEEDAAQAVPVAESRNGWEDAQGGAGDASGETEDEDEDEDEDAAVAEALAALEAATAGEDVDED